MVLAKNEKTVAYQTYMAKGTNTHAPGSFWSDYKWQLKNAIRSIDAFERFTGITFTVKERKKMEKTIQKFPIMYNAILCIAHKAGELPPRPYI